MPSLLVSRNTILRRGDIRNMQSMVPARNEGSIQKGDFLVFTGVNDLEVKT